MSGGNWRMTHCLHAFIVNITPKSKVLLKYHTYRTTKIFGDVLYATYQTGFSAYSSNFSPISVPKS